MKLRLLGMVTFGGEYRSKRRATGHDIGSLDPLSGTRPNPDRRVFQETAVICG